jgi:hypothetical protein
MDRGPGRCGDAVNQRQRYALTHPITDPSDERTLTRVSRRLQTAAPHPSGYTIVTTLAVDR